MTCCTYPSFYLTAVSWNDFFRLRFFERKHFHWRNSILFPQLTGHRMTNFTALMTQVGYVKPLKLFNWNQTKLSLVFLWIFYIFANMSHIYGNLWHNSYQQFPLDWLIESNKRDTFSFFCFIYDSSTSKSLKLCSTFIHSKWFGGCQKQRVKKNISQNCRFGKNKVIYKCILYPLAIDRNIDGEEEAK